MPIRNAVGDRVKTEAVLSLLAGGESRVRESVFSGAALASLLTPQLCNRAGARSRTTSLPSLSAATPSLVCCIVMTPRSFPG